MMGDYHRQNDQKMFTCPKCGAQYEHDQAYKHAVVRGQCPGQNGNKAVPWVALGLVLAWACPGWAYEDVIGAKYVRCHDGDTCTVTMAGIPDVFGKEIEVRFRGIDTPELRAKCPKELAKAQAAKQITTSMVSKAKTLRLSDVHRDKYFRLNATVWADGVNVNQSLVEMGYAVPYTGQGVKEDWCQ